MGMIHIDGDYYIKPDEQCYTLVRKTDFTDKKTGGPVYRSLTYHETIAGCIRSYVRFILKNRIVTAKDMELSDAIKVISDSAAHVDEVVGNLTRGE